MIPVIHCRAPARLPHAFPVCFKAQEVSSHEYRVPTPSKGRETLGEAPHGSSRLLSSRVGASLGSCHSHPSLFNPSGSLIYVKAVV